MRIGIAGPTNLNLLNLDSKYSNLPNDYAFSMNSYFVNNLLERGFEITLFCLSKEIDKTIIIRQDKLIICIVPLYKQPGRRFFNHEINELTKLIKKFKPDIIHALWSYEFALAALKTNIPSVISLHDHAGIILKHKFDQYRIIRWVMNYRAIKKSRYLISNSQYLYDLLTPKQKSKTRIISNFFPDKLDQYFNTYYNKKNYILTISNGFGRRKNVKNGIIAFSHLRKKYPELEYHIIGIDMESGGPAERFAIENNIAEGIKFISQKPFHEVVKSIAHAKVVLHPSLEESFGMTVLEPMVIGTPVIGGVNSGNVPYLLNFGKAGVVCDISKPKEIADKIDYLIKNEEYVENIRNEAYKFAKEKYNEDLIVSQHLEYYAEILKK